MIRDAAYAIQNNDLTLDNEARQYVLRVRDMPISDKPRERLIELGPSELAVHELLAVVLMVGTVREDVLAMSSRVLKEYGQKSLFSYTNAKALAADLGVPLTKAAQIVACGELGRRFYKRSGASMPIIRTAEDVFAHTKDMHHLPKENLRGIYLNAHYQVIYDEIISIGTIDANIIHPREVFRPALEYSAAGVILVHNHPSGVATPSEADTIITQQLIEAGKLLGIDLIDHVIVTTDGYTSLLV